MKILQELLTVAIIALVCLSPDIAGAQNIRPDDLRFEYFADPLGIDVVRPRLSWKLEYAQLAICHSPDQSIFWDIQETRVKHLAGKDLS